jgi:hypothetical protein
VGETFKVAALAFAASVALAGCAGIGPERVTRDRFDYVGAISESWKQQMLLNLLKVRYSDAPVFLDVSSVIASYTLGASASVKGEYAPPGRGDTVAGIGLGANIEERPTITFSPLAGEKFARSLMTPLPVSGILYLLQAGFPAENVLRACAISVNGLENAYGGRENAKAGDPRFAELLRALRAAQRAGVIDVRQRSPKDRDAAVLAFHPARETPQAARVRELLGVAPDTRELEVVYGAFPASPRELAILTRSMLQVMADFASQIELPERDTQEGRAHVLDPNEARDEKLFPTFLRVRHGAAAPADAYVAVKYRGVSFWVDDRDEPSKATFSKLMFMLALTETTGPTAGAPVLTVPAR